MLTRKRQVFGLQTIVGYVCVLLVTLIFSGLPALAHPYLHGDYWTSLEALATDMPNQLNGLMQQYVGCPLWSTSCNSQTAVYLSVAGQDGPYWIGADHGNSGGPNWTYTGTGVPEQAEMAMLDAILNPGACIDGLPMTTVNAIRNAFAANRGVPMPEITVTNVRITGNVHYIIDVGVDETVTITTGARNQLCANAPIIGRTCFDVDVPPMEQLLDDAFASMDEAIRNMTAAYHTIGDSRGVNYWYAFMGRLGFTFLKELLPGLLNNLKQDSDEIYVPTSDPGEALRAVVLLGFAAGDLVPEGKGTVSCAPWGTVTDFDTGTLPRINFDGGYVDNARVRIPGEYVCAAISNWAANYLMSSGRYQNQTTRLATAASGPNGGDLNGDGTRNLASWQASSGSLTAYLARENAKAPANFTLTQDLQSPPLPVGASQITWTVGIPYPNLTFTYDWYMGQNPSSLQPVSPPVNNPTLTANMTSPGTWYFQCVVTAACSGAQAASTMAQVNYIPITFTKQPPEQTYVQVDNPETLTGLVEAKVYDESPVTYQWYRKVSGSPDFEPFGPATPTGNLTFPTVEPTDAGYYFCRVTSTVYGHSVDSSQMFVFVSGASLKIYDALAGQGPYQGELIMSSGTMNINTNSATMDVNGTTYFGEINSGVCVFRFQFVSVNGGVCNVTGSRPLSITSASDLRWSIPIGVVPGTLGGGTGGQGGAKAPIPGSGGEGQTAYGGGGSRGYFGGKGIDNTDPDGKNGTAGGSGGPGASGQDGTPGYDGSDGQAGTLGYGSKGWAGTGGSKGTGGQRGFGGGPGAAGQAGVGGAGTARAQNANTYKGWDGGSATPGGNGGSGTPG
ncbi:MAG: hypothetical protein KBH78_07235, partial [Candidatus Hydrogenedentes bacterium]|nr:hypothetical protein [Candidatus Hydrogenedentota bacterium]